MDTQLLTAFTIAAENHSFSKTAELLGISQSAVSKRIALLEKSVGSLLFDRISRRIVLTEAGKSLLPRAKQIIQSIEDAQQFMFDRGGEVSGQLRIATSHHIGIHRLPESLSRFTTQYPDVHLQLHFLDSEQAIEAILHGDYDLALITLSDDILEEKNEWIQSHTLWEDPMYFVSNDEHPLSQHKQLQLSELATYPAILPDATTQTTQLVKRLFTDANKELDVAMNTNHLDAIKMMISVGLGWSVLPQTLIKDHLHRLPVVNGDDSSALTRYLGCIYHRERTLSNAARAMVNLLRNSSKAS